MINMKDRILKYILIALAAMNILDYLFTLRAIYVMGATEANPIMAAAMDAGLFGPVKLLAVPGLCYLMWRVRHRWRRPAIVGLLMFVTSAYSGALTLAPAG